MNNLLICFVSDTLIVLLFGTICMLVAPIVVGVIFNLFEICYFRWNLRKDCEGGTLNITFSVIVDSLEHLISLH